MKSSKSAETPRVTRLAAGIVAALLLVPAAHAAEPEAADPSATDATPEARPTDRKDEGVVELGSIVVTARRREERELDVPIAITTVTAEDIRTKGILNSNQILNQTPGASAEDAGGGISGVQIRGVSTTLGGSANGYYIDDTPFTAVTTSFYPDTRSWDIDHVEVLKGPQGTLFGEGSMGGTVRIITAKPDLYYFRSDVELSSAAVKDGGNGWGAKAMVNVPIVEDRLGLRVALTREDVPGWIDDSSTGDRDTNALDISTARAKLRFAPTDNLTFDLAYWKSKTTTDNGSTSSTDDLTTTSVSPIENEWNTGSLTATWDLDGSQLVYVGSDADFDIGVSQVVPPIIDIDATIAIGVRTQDLRWASTGARNFDWTVGYYTRKATRDDVTAGTVGGFPYNTLSSQSNDAYAIYGEGTVHMGAHWDLTAGVRYFSDDVDGKSVSGASTTTLDDTFDAWSPRLALAYKPSENATLYASAARGFRSGQLQPATSYALGPMFGLNLAPGVDPDTITTYELGGKFLLADGKLLVDGAIYYSDWDDVAIRIPLGIPGLNGLVNGPGSTSLGAEMSLAYRPTANLSLQFGGSWTDATYSGDVPGTNLQDGMPVYNVPKTMLTASGSYGWDIGSSLRGLAYLGANYHTAVETNALASNLGPGDALLSATARVGVESPSGWAAYVYGSNLTNEDGAVTPPTAVGSAERMQPRTYGVVLRYTY